jgi:hypothetical protein
MTNFRVSNVAGGPSIPLPPAAVSLPPEAESPPEAGVPPALVSPPAEGAPPTLLLPPVFVPPVAAPPVLAVAPPLASSSSEDEGPSSDVQAPLLKARVRRVRDPAKIEVRYFMIQ